MGRREDRTERLLPVLQDTVSTCTKCWLHGNWNGPIPYRGPIPADLVVIGEAPSLEDVAKGGPFLDRGGNFLRSMFWRAQIRQDSVGYMNVVSCHTLPEGASKKHREPTLDEQASCQGNMFTQLSLAAPHVVLLAGRVAMRAFRPDFDKVTDHRGVPFTWGKGPIMIPILHPNAVLSVPALKDQMEGDVRQAGNRLRRAMRGNRTTAMNKWPRHCVVCGKIGGGPGSTSSRYDDDNVAYCPFHFRTKDMVEDGTAVPQTLGLP